MLELQNSFLTRFVLPYFTPWKVGIRKKMPWQMPRGLFEIQQYFNERQILRGSVQVSDVTQNSILKMVPLLLHISVRRRSAGSNHLPVGGAGTAECLRVICPSGANCLWP